MGLILGIMMELAVYAGIGLGCLWLISLFLSSVLGFLLIAAPVAGVVAACVLTARLMWIRQQLAQGAVFEMADGGLGFGFGGRGSGPTAAGQAAVQGIVVPQVKRRDINDVMAELNGMIGLGSVKGEIKKLVDFVAAQQARKRAGAVSEMPSIHLVALGNPGTGKTVVCRLLAEIMGPNGLGILRIGHLVETDRSGLVAGYLGQTAIKTKEVFDKARGGVLMIDEAYSIAGNSSNGQRDQFSAECIDTLLKLIEDARDDIMVIICGYTHQMQHFLYSNPGMRSRFTRYINFPNYEPDELLEIFMRLVKKEKYEIEDAATSAARMVFDGMAKRAGDKFGNGRDVRTFFERVREASATRVAAMEGPKADADYCKITAHDIAVADRRA
ncbi:MAG: AAA family ATPase [Rhodospirillaceae bacterium]